jgi:hypothetical protein
MFMIRLFYESAGLGMQPKLLCPRRNHFAPRQEGPLEMGYRDVVDQQYNPDRRNCQQIADAKHHAADKPGSLFPGPVEFPFVFAVLDGLPFVVFALPAGQGHGDFGFSIPEIHFQGNQGKPLFPHFAVESLELGLFKQQFAHPQGFMIVVEGKGIGADVHLADKQFAFFEFAVGIFQVGASQTHGFALSSQQHHAGLDFFVNMIIVTGFPVIGYYFNMIIAQVNAFLLCSSF